MAEYLQKKVIMVESGSRESIKYQVGNQEYGGRDYSRAVVVGRGTSVNCATSRVSIPPSRISIIGLGSINHPGNDSESSGEPRGLSMLEQDAVQQQTGMPQAHLLHIRMLHFLGLLE